MRSSRSVVVASAGFDIVLLFVFVAIGRASHGEGAQGFLITLWPFAVGLIVGWLVARAWRTPRRIVWTGVIVWACTVVVGMLLRLLSDQGVQLAFVVVTVIVLGVFFLGWRALSSLVIRLLRGA